MNQYYEIRLKGHLDNSWGDALAGLAIIHNDNGETLLTGFLPDQSALHGVLNRLRDLGVTLISVNAPETTSDSSDLLEESKDDEYKDD